jgi:hypothetical protein
VTTSPTFNRGVTPPLGEKWIKSYKHKTYVRTRNLVELKSLVNIEWLTAKS